MEHSFSVNIAVDLGDVVAGDSQPIIFLTIGFFWKARLSSVFWCSSGAPERSGKGRLP